MLINQLRIQIEKPIMLNVPFFFKMIMKKEKKRKEKKTQQEQLKHTIQVYTI